MSENDTFDRVLASLQEASLDDTRWPAASVLIDNACRAKGTHLVYGAGSTDDEVQIFFARLMYHGQHNSELEREYFDYYHHWDERLPRIRRLPDSRLVHVTDLYIDQEVKSSLVFNEALPRAHLQKSLVVRLDGRNGSRIIWAIADPIDGESWPSPQIDMIRRLMPHVRQYVCVRQVLADTGALGASLAALLENTGSAVIQLDRLGRLVAASDRARDLLLRGDGLFDAGGFLFARSPQENAALQKLLGSALPRDGGRGVSGSMTVRRFSLPPPRLVLHVSPVGQSGMDFSAGRVAALVLVVDPEIRARIDPALVAASLGLTAVESQVAAMLAEGRSVREIATATGRKERTIRWHMEQIFSKHGISRQAELVGLVLSLAGAPQSRH